MVWDKQGHDLRLDSCHLGNFSAKRVPLALQVPDVKLAIHPSTDLVPAANIVPGQRVVDQIVDRPTRKGENFSQFRMSNDMFKPIRLSLEVPARRHAGENAAHVGMIAWQVGGGR